MAAARGAEVVALDGNPGFGAANNAGVARARHDVTVLLNPDVVALDGGAARARRARAAARDALHVPRLLNADGSVQRSAHPLPGRPRRAAARARPSARCCRAGRARGPTRGARGPTARSAGRSPRRVAARTATLRALGPFDPARSCSTRTSTSACAPARPASRRSCTRRLRWCTRGSHSTGPALGGEPHELQARRRREVVGAALGPRALALDDAAQAPDVRHARRGPRRPAPRRLAAARPARGAARGARTPR